IKLAPSEMKNVKLKTLI
ncbi:hypothetical protein JL09_g6794, partial [Pichia kudriavzevii]